jgi:uncharacterized OB-fold protein
MDARPAPVPDPETAPYWEAAVAHELRLPRCAKCGHYEWVPKPRCSACLADALEWVKVSGRGTVFSFAIMRETFIKAFPPPYVVAQVELEEQPGLVLIANIVDAEVGDVAIGQPVEVTFDDRSAEVSIPQFRPRRAGA